MDNSFFYGMMEENISKKAVYTAGFLLAVPSRLSIPYDLPIEKMQELEVLLVETAEKIGDLILGVNTGGDPVQIEILQ